MMDKSKTCYCLKTQGNLLLQKARGLLKSHIASISFLPLLVLPFAAQSQFNYITNDGAIAITRYTGPGGAVVIPSMINGRPVTSINAAFYNSINLTSVTIPDSVTNIGEYAFYNCFNLTNFDISSSLTSIAISALFFCKSIGAITVDPFNPVYSSIEGVLFDKKQTQLISCPETKSGNYVVPDSITNIGSYAFLNCTHLTSIKMPDTVTEIRTHAFYFCTQMTNIIISKRVATIPDYAFYNCFNLASVVIPETVTNIGDSAFYGSGSPGVYFKGKPPSASELFVFTSQTIYYLPGSPGWSNTFAGRPTAIWQPQMKTLGAQKIPPAFNRFAFNIDWVAGQTVTVEYCTNFSNPFWQPLQTLTLSSDSTTYGLYYGDSQWTNYPIRFYRLRSP